MSGYIDNKGVKALGNSELSHTQYFNNLEKEQKNEVMEVLESVHRALTEKGYNPVNQIVGYILSGDPTYITSQNNARGMISKLERDELLEEIVTFYLKNRIK